jgi:hypothetical protein
MPTNNYISHGVRSEQDLYEDLIIESMQIYGQDVYYLPRNIVEEDTILNEEIVSKFDSSYIIEMYLKDVEGFEGDDFLSKFGLQIIDQCTLIVSRRRWEQLVNKTNNKIEQNKPHEGDLIYVPFSQSLFEIRFVEDQVPFFQLNKLPCYELRCELFKYENQDLDTGIATIDSIEGQYATLKNVYVTVLNGTFVAGEKITLTTGSGKIIKAEVTKIQTNESGKIFSLTNVTYPDGEFIRISEGMNIVGDRSNAEGVIGSVVGLSNPEYSILTNDKYQDNSEFEKNKFNFIDFSENNPFGEM